MFIRQIESGDVEAVLALWAEAGMTSHAQLGDSRQETTEKMTRDSDLFLVGEANKRIVATVMGTYDGHRGRIKRLAVKSDCRRSGLGHQIVSELESRFAERGIFRVRLEVWAENKSAQTFWENLGYQLQSDIRYYLRNFDQSVDCC